MHLYKDIYFENCYFLEISHALANKGQGLRTWSGLMNCEPAEIAAFGDNLNDVGMFEAAGVKAVVANAHPRLLALADVVVESNDEDGVARYIDKM